MNRCARHKQPERFILGPRIQKRSSIMTGRQWWSPQFMSQQPECPERQNRRKPGSLRPALDDVLPPTRPRLFLSTISQLPQRYHSINSVHWVRAALFSCLDAPSSRHADMCSSELGAFLHSVKVTVQVKYHSCLLQSTSASLIDSKSHYSLSQVLPPAFLCSGQKEPPHEKEPWF